MADDINESSILQNADALAEGASRAQRAQAEFKSRDSVTSPQASMKPNVNLDDGESDFDKLTAEVINDPSNPAEENAAAPAPARSKSKPDENAEPAEVPEAAESEKKSTLDDLLKAAQADETPAKEAKPEESAEDPYAKHQLPANASSKSREHFDRLKTEAASRERSAQEARSAAESRAKDLETQLAAAQTSAGKLTPELEQELKDLREHRALFDTERDPAFQQKFDSRLDRNYSSIYADLQRHGLPESEVAKLKAFPKADRDRAIDGFLDKLESSDRRSIEAKLVSNASIESERADELSRIRGNAAEHLKSQQQAPQAAAVQRADAIANIVAPQIRGLSWLYPKDVPNNTPPELRKQLESHNEFALKLQSDLRSAIANDDPETRATAALSVPLAQYFARENAGLKSRLAELNTKLERFTAATRTSRLSERASSKSDSPKPAADISQDPNDALDALFNEATASKR